MKKSAFVAIVFFLLISFSGHAQKFAYIDSQYILDNIPEFAEAQAQLDELSNQWQKEIDAKFADIDKTVEILIHAVGQHQHPWFMVTDDAVKTAQRTLFAQRSQPDAVEIFPGQNLQAFKVMDIAVNARLRSNDFIAAEIACGNFRAVKQDAVHNHRMVMNAGFAACRYEAGQFRRCRNFRFLIYALAVKRLKIRQFDPVEFQNIFMRGKILFQSAEIVPVNAFRNIGADSIRFGFHHFQNPSNDRAVDGGFRQVFEDVAGQYHHAGIGHQPTAFRISAQRG